MKTKNINFNVGDILYDARSKIVVKLVDDKNGKAILIDKLQNPDSDVYIEAMYCRPASLQQIHQALNEPTTQWDRLRETPALTFEEVLALQKSLNIPPSIKLLSMLNILHIGVNSEKEEVVIAFKIEEKDYKSVFDLLKQVGEAIIANSLGREVWVDAKALTKLYKDFSKRASKDNRSFDHWQLLYNEQGLGFTGSYLPFK